MIRIRRKDRLVLDASDASSDRALRPSGGFQRQQNKTVSVKVVGGAPIVRHSPCMEEGRPRRGGEDGVLPSSEGGAS